MTQGVLVSHDEVVNTTPSVLWRVLIDKIRHPDKFLPVRDVTVVRENIGGNPDAIERTMKMGDNLIHEIISTDPVTLTVVFRMHADHPVFRGFVINTILPFDKEEIGGGGAAAGAEEPTRCVLRFSMVWEPKENAPAGAVEAAREGASEKIAAGVRSTKQAAETLAAQKSN